MELNKKVGRNSVFGIFNDQTSLDKAVNRLKTENFRNADISVLMQSKQDTKDFAFEKNTKAPEGATTGAATGAVAGGIFGWLVGAGALAIPGLGPFIAAGPIMAAIAGAGVGGTVGGIAGGLIGLGIPEFEAQRYEGYVKDGGMLISVHVDDKTLEARAKKILEECGAKNVATTSEKKSAETNTSYQRTPVSDVDETRNNFR
ncbi:MAG: DUF3341 domain-containing protein [Bacteriovorax sp.]|nr:DUF3341 domain-containing protein [Bacteriovorax sp.]